MQDLIARLSAASEGSQELDAEVYVAVLATGARHRRASRPAPPYTTSLDTALTLVPDGLLLSIKRGWQPGPWLVYLDREEAGAIKWVAASVANTAALALCIAALKARAAEHSR